LISQPSREGCCHWLFDLNLFHLTWYLLVVPPKKEGEVRAFNTGDYLKRRQVYVCSLGGLFFSLTLFLVAPARWRNVFRGLSNFFGSGIGFAMPVVSKRT
jgi:hypothetical protein